jgi:hypothetical protein
MKKFIASVGLAALGASTLQAQYSPGVTPAELAKPWSLGLSLRGFYDDNYLTLPNARARETWGEEISPSASVNHTFNNTALTLSYIFDMRHYDDHGTTDLSHIFKASVNQSFSDRFKMQASESFISAQQPEVLAGSGLTATPLRAEGNNIHNTGNLSLTAGLSEKLDMMVSYQNDVYAYRQLFGDANGTAIAAGTGAFNPSYSALLDRMEQLATVNLDWKVMNQLTGIVGYTYGHTGYTSPEAIVYDSPSGRVPTAYSQIRNSDSHYFFVGADERFTSQLNGSIRAGGQYLDYYNTGTDDLSPYVDANLTWTYMRDSSLQAGIKHQHSATDVVGQSVATTGANKGLPVMDAEDTAAYLSMNQQITGGFTGGVMGQFQHSVFNGGALNSESENFFIMGLNFAYRFNDYFNAEAGYNWYKLVSDVTIRDYTRNMVYIGVRATY